jgi:hypothetical protein
VIQNLTEDFLYQRLPEGLVALDERGLIQAVVGGYQDRVEDLRAYSKKLELLFQTSGLPETGNNVVLVDITSPQGKVYTRSLDLQTDTPPDGTAALTTWVLLQIGYTSTDNIANIRYGRDLLRLVDVNTLDYLAATIGAVLYQSSALTDAEQTTANQQILQTYFPRLKFKGTARSFETLGRILGFDDVKVTPLWGRLSPHVPNDIGSPTNDPDFLAIPDYYPQQQIDAFYDPLKTNDGPYASWSGTIAPGTASTQFATQVVNGFNPWVNVEVLAVQYGTSTLPSAGSYALEGGAPHKKAAVEVNDLRFEAVAEGEWFNGIQVMVADSGSNRALSILDRLSSVKYRSSYFDLAITAEFDRVEELYGSSAMKRNKDLAANPSLTPDGTAVSPYRPWTAGSISTGSHAQDWLVQQGSNSPTVVTARVQSSGTNRQLNVDELVSAGVQVVQALEEVRPATRLARSAGIGFLIRDQVGYAAYIKESLLFLTANGEGSFSPNVVSASWYGSHVDTPAAPFYATILLDNGTTKIYPEAVVDPLNPQGFLFKSLGFDGTYDFSSGTYLFTFTPPFVGTNVYALWHPTSTEVIRTEPADGTEKGYQARPEDQENGNLDEVADDFPWRRDLTLGGEVVDVTVYDSIAPDALTEPAENVMSIPGQDGAEYSAFAVNSSATPIPRLITDVRTIGPDYKHGMMATAYKGTLKNLPAISEAPGLTELERFFEPGAKLYTVGSVQGVLVADPNKFYSPAHRTGLVAWFAFNEHPDADLTVVDHSAIAGDLLPINALPSVRQWDDTRGWCLNASSNAIHYSTVERPVTDEFTLSFWLRLGGTLGNIFKFGLLRIDYENVGDELKVYYADQFIGSIFPNFGDSSTFPFSFISISVSPTEIIFGLGNLSTELVQWHFPGTYPAMTGTDIAITGQQLGWSDLRIWNVLKTEDELNSVRNYEPVDTQTAYQIGTLKNVNTHDRYGLRVLECGLVAVASLPAWYTEPRVSFVTRYNSLGRYEGESRFKEVGLGGGPLLPDSYKLGVQFQNMTADADAVVSTASGWMPGENKLWLDSPVPPSYLKIIHTGSDAYDVFVSSGTSSPGLSESDPIVTELTAWWTFEETGEMSQGARPRFNSLAPADTNQAFFQSSQHSFPPEDGREWDSGVGKIGNGLQSPLSSGDNSQTYAPSVGDGSLPPFSPQYPRNAADSFSFCYWTKFQTKEFFSESNYASIGGVSFGVDGDSLSFEIEGNHFGGAWHLFATVWNGVSVFGETVDLVFDFTVDQWYFFTFVYDGATGLLSFYIDGTLVGATTNPEVFSAPGIVDSVQIIASSVTNVFIVDELAVWATYKLTEENIAYLFNNGDGVTYPFAFPGGTAQINEMVETNTGQDAIWVLGDDGYMYEVSLVSSGTGAALVAELIARQRTDMELEISSFGTEDWNLLRYSEQPTGAQTIIAQGGTILTVGSHGTTVYQKAFSGTYDTPPAFLYLSSRVVVDVDNAWDQWTENTNDTAFGNQQTPPVAALDEDGVLEFTNTGSITPGNYRLTVISGNIGKADSDFDGFSVEITVDATVMEKRLCQGQSGYNFTGTDAFEFPIENGVNGEWLLSFDWFNALSDPARGTARQLAIFNYKLERLTTELYQVAIGGSALDVTRVDTNTFYGTTPGGWIASINSYGSVSGYQHESTVYPTQDTITLKTPLSEILTGATIERREDVLGPSGIVLTNGTVPVMPSFGTIMDSGTNSFDPVWLWSGGVTGDSVALAAKVAINSPAVRFAVSLYGTIGPDAIYSDVLVADNDNSNTVKANVDGLIANNTYYYGVEMGGSLAAGFIGQFKTFDASTRNFSFALGSCSNNTVAAAVNPISFDHILDKDPLFFIHMGDMHYNDGANEPHTIASYHNCWDKVFQLSSRQRRFWQQMMVEYIWDDHDYGPNDSAGNWEFKKFARLAFQQTVPTYPLAAGSGNVPLYRSWSVGRCFFIMLDTRSEATPQVVTDGPSKSRLGFAQKTWLKQQLLFGAANYAFTFIVNPTTWGGAASPGSDTWAGYAFERREILDFIVGAGIKGIAMLSGDMHGCAFDDGTNNAFGTGSTGGLAILQAAPLDQSASQKGTPYLDGPYPVSGSANRKQYGMVTVADSGTGTPFITFQAFNDTTGTDTQLFTHSFYGTASPL